MFPLCGFIILLCLQCGGLCNAFHVAETLSLEVEYGESAVLHCNGSAYLEEEGSVHWEVMGEDVAVLQGEEPTVGEHYEGRVQVPSEEQLREGDWSVVLNQTMLSDTDMYECIWQGRKTISTVWLTVHDPPAERFMTVEEGTRVDLPCYIRTSRTPSNKLKVWWSRNDETLITLNNDVSVISELSESDTVVVGVSGEENHLYMTAAVSDSGEYRCWYTTRESEDPRAGIPESITLTVLGQIPTETGPLLSSSYVSDPDDSTTPALSRTDEVTQGETVDFLPVVLEDFTQPATDITQTSSESFQWDTLPWIRIGLIGGVLVVTAVVLCVLGALHKI